MAKAEKLLRIRITNASVDFMLHVRITNDHWMQSSLAEPFISQDSEKLRFQKSRKPQSTNVFSNQPDSLPRTRGRRRFAVKNRYADSSTCAYFSKSSFNSSGFAVSPADGTRFRSAGGIDLPGFKNVYCLRNWAAKAILCADFAKAKWNLHSIYERQIGAVGIAIQRRGRLP